MVTIKKNASISTLDRALAELNNAGKIQISRGSDSPAQNLERIPTGIMRLDDAIGGGIPRGRITELFGKEAGGKCLVKETYLWTNGGLQTVEEIFNQLGLRASCTTRVTNIEDSGLRIANENGEMERVSLVTHNGARPVKTITLDSGRQITTTARHPLRVINESGYIVWKNTEDILIGDYVLGALWGGQHASDKDQLTLDEAEFLGYLIADGTLGYKSRLNYTKTYSDARERYIDLLGSLFGKHPIVYDDKEVHVNDIEFRKLLVDKYDLDYVGSAHKVIPPKVRASGPEVQRMFLCALFDGDGHIGPSHIEYTSASETLAREIQIMLYGFGIPMSLSPKKAANYEQTYWRLHVSGPNALRLLDFLGTISHRRKDQAQKIKDGLASTSISRIEGIPHLAFMVRSLGDSIRGDREFSSLYTDMVNKVTCSKSRLEKIILWAEKNGGEEVAPAQGILSHLRFLQSLEVTYEKVVSIEDAGTQPTFDIVVPGTHSFLANGFISHNTTLALHTVARAQQAGLNVAYLDMEQTLDPTYMEALGVDWDSLILSQPDYAEQVFETMEKLAMTGEVALIVVDSVAAMSPRQEAEGDYGDANVGSIARVMSQGLKKLNPHLANTKTAILFINQLRANIGAYSPQGPPPDITTGGKALKFYASLRLEVNRIGAVKAGDNIIGATTKAKVIKNKTFAPYKEATFDIIYGKGVSRGSSIIDKAVELGVVKRSGAWYTDAEGESLGQGKPAVIELLDTNNEMYARILSGVEGR